MARASGCCGRLCSHATPAGSSAALHAGGNRATRRWLNSPGVAEALHVKSDVGGMRYHKGPMSFSGNLLPLYAELMAKYRMLIYSGDTDACVPTWGTVDWCQPATDATHADAARRRRARARGLCAARLRAARRRIDSLNLTVKSPWKPWRAEHLDGSSAQRAGYVKTYTTNDFTFATVQGAGHMVPTYKPHFALTMLSKWLKNEPLA